MSLSDYILDGAQRQTIASFWALRDIFVNDGLWLCVDGPGFARFDLTVLQGWSGAAMCPAFGAALMAAGPNAIRGSGPNYNCELEAP